MQYHPLRESLRPKESLSNPKHVPGHSQIHFRHLHRQEYPISSHNPPATEKDIVKNAKDILKLVLRGYDSLVFSDIRKIYAELATELRPE
ncbi:hypothetical protein, partial [uncultured Acetatifactor sp.]|uniref:hypothetical protein n=1 Tax=uncultured Acetatifactor sp. TaxID=1671927 RepID=UPI00272BE041